MGPLYHLKIGHYAHMKASRMGLETTLTRVSPRHDGCVDDQRTGIGDEFKVFVYQDRLILLEDAGLRSVRALS